ncbi:twin-arginine translocation pathway signal protein [Novosphingobium sp. MMS21-SN21R]|uniref:twin-arginine translocation pathway signal protein n=1 Tax=Novosphingobium sp. MMS21-SN21R TaxID=2969298 RepID=UPI0028881CAE|nr:twin-arginine translocation pathway signal protein [Novosphingobium sp. MMS21-SN21R]MDT0507295.1 twin-arginine translocation pathway signal protein [Novosphingobium sp. MMS21-SN21R]
MNLGRFGAVLALAMMITAGVPAQAGDAAATPAVSPVPASFTVPTLAQTPKFKLVPLGPALVKIDFDAYMSSIDHLQKTFTRSPDWPHTGITDVDAMRDMETEQARFQARTSFAYAVLTPDGLRERGCVYVYPSPVKGYDAEVRMWVTKAEHDAGFDAELYTWVQGWMRTDWPFKNVAYPGRAIGWEEWDSKVAASKAG